MSFSGVLASAQPIEHGFRITVPPEWHQGRTAYGGFSSALALSAAMRVTDGLPSLRSAQVSMIAPVVGEVEVRAHLLRSGKNASWVSAEITGDKGICFTATFVFMGPVESALHVNDQPLPDDLIAPDDAVPLSKERGVVFLRHQFDVRFALPRSALKQPEICWWVRLCQREELDPMVELLLCADSLPAGVMPLLPPTVPISTMQWQANVLCPQPATRDGWWLLRTLGDYAENGCSSQRMGMWNARGEAMLTGIQSVALFG
ncbi:MAG: thioesterase family protein [Novosphingobium sp.]|nr:thioesterase family protein [Novosphingobium sp.]